MTTSTYSAYSRSCHNELAEYIQRGNCGMPPLPTANRWKEGPSPQDLRRQTVIAPAYGGASRHIARLWWSSSEIILDGQDRILVGGI